MIKVEKAPTYVNEALSALFLGIAEAHGDVTTYQDKHAEPYDLGRAIGRALLDKE